MAEPLPKDISVSRTRGTCEVTWADGSVAKLRLTDLRRLCPCSKCNEQRDKAASGGIVILSGPEPSDQLLSVEPVGGYAVRFLWADGHSSGIYSYTFLRQVADGG